MTLTLTLCAAALAACFSLDDDAGLLFGCAFLLLALLTI